MSTDFHDPSEQLRLRRVLGKFATGITVITTRAANGVRLGITANSFNSVSLDPPLILWSLARSADSLPAYEAAKHFAVHILAEDQLALSEHFARPQQEKFAAVPFVDGIGGAPLFDGCAARFQCRTHALHDGGDHVIIVGEVLQYEEAACPGLVYYEGSYAVAAAHPAMACAENDAPETVDAGRISHDDSDEPA